VEEKATAVRHGALFSRAITEVPVLGQTLPSWARAGEASGDMAGLFSHAAERNREQWTAFIQRTVTIIEPALIIIVAIFVLIVALAILLPILSLNQQLA
jgi:type II secretory pathway component PulF